MSCCKKSSRQIAAQVKIPNNIRPSWNNSLVTKTGEEAEKAEKKKKDAAAALAKRTAAAHTRRRSLQQSREAAKSQGFGRVGNNSSSQPQLPVDNVNVLPVSSDTPNSVASSFELPNSTSFIQPNTNIVVSESVDFHNVGNSNSFSQQPSSNSTPNSENYGQGFSSEDAVVIGDISSAYISSGPNTVSASNSKTSSDHNNTSRNSSKDSSAPKKKKSERPVLPKSTRASTAVLAMNRAKRKGGAGAKNNADNSTQNIEGRHKSDQDPDLAGLSDDGLGMPEELPSSGSAAAVAEEKPAQQEPEKPKEEAEKPKEEEAPKKKSWFGWGGGSAEDEKPKTEEKPKPAEPEKPKEEEKKKSGGWFGWGGGSTKEEEKPKEEETKGPVEPAKAEEESPDLNDPEDPAEVSESADPASPAGPPQEAEEEELPDLNDPELADAASMIGQRFRARKASQGKIQQSSPPTSPKSSSSKPGSKKSKPPPSPGSGPLDDAKVRKETMDALNQMEAINLVRRVTNLQNQLTEKDNEILELKDKLESLQSV